MRIKEANHDEHQFRPFLPLNNCYMMHHFFNNDDLLRFNLQLF